MSQDSYKFFVILKDTIEFYKVCGIADKRRLFTHTHTQKKSSGIQLQVIHAATSYNKWKQFTLEWIAATFFKFCHCSGRSV